MFLFGQLVIGAPGAGKSTYCAGLVDMFTQIGRPVITINLDPANDIVPFKCHIDIRELITVEDAMEYCNLGPNGALRYCMQMLLKNIDWLLHKVKKLDKEGYLIIDMPGQLELYNSDDTITKIISQFTKWEWRLCAIHLSDSVFITDSGKFVSMILAALSIMINLEVPQLNVLTKADLLDTEKLPYDFKFFEELPDTQYLADLLDDHPFMMKYKDLTSKLCDVIDNYGLVTFHPISVKSQELMKQLIKQADLANGFNYIESEDLRAIANFQGAQNPVSVPRGIFHYSMRERGIGSNFKVPDSEDFSAVQLGGKFRTKDSTIDGFYLPMPMGMDPINFQLLRAREKFNELQTDPDPESVEEAYSKMRKECQFEATVMCEKSMRRYYDIKMKQEDEAESPIHEKLLKLSDVISRARVRNDESNDLGVLFSAPGISPIGWHTNMARLNRNNIKVD